MDKNRKLVNIQGHTADDKIKSIEKHLEDIYRMKESMGRPDNKYIPIIIPAYGESSKTTRDKIYSSFATRTIKLKGAMISIDCHEKNKVYLELEIVRETGLIDSFAKMLTKGAGEIPLVDVIVYPRDIINVYMTYTPEVPDTADSVNVTSTIYGETLA